jgi:hypothetical protein
LFGGGDLSQHGVCGGMSHSIAPSCLMTGPGLASGGVTALCGQEGPSGWAIVRLRLGEGPGAPVPAGATIVSASSDAFGQFAQKRYETAPLDIPRSSDGSPLAKVVETLLAAPGRACEDLWLQIPTTRPRLPEADGVSGVLYFRATTNGERFVTFDVLYTDVDWEQMQRLSAYATQFFRVWLWHGTEQHSPRELYGSVMVQGGHVGVAVGAGTKLPVHAAPRK